MKVYKDTPFQFGFLTCQIRPPQPMLMVVVKATFDVVPGGTCTIAPTQTLTHGAVHYDDEMTQSARFDTDFTLLKRRGECFLAGTFHAPGGRPVPTSAVAFKCGRVAKSLAIFGDRYWGGSVLSGGLSEPQPIATLPLRYEFSFGGPSFEKNPVGRGIEVVDTPAGKRRLLPNIENPLALITSPNDRPEPAGAFPIPQDWRARIRLAGTYDARWLKTRWPWFPEDFDPAYFNAAPADQQIDGFWRGDEEIGLQNLHPTTSKIVSRLPGLRSRCYLEVRAGSQLAFSEVSLALDTIVLDADAMQVRCLWRGLTEVQSEKLAEIETLFFVHEELQESHPLDHYRAWLERKKREEAEEDQAFEPEPPPEPEAVPDTIPPEADPMADMLKQLDDAMAAAKEKGGPEGVIAEAALYIAKGAIVEDAKAPAGPPPPKPSEVRKSLKEAGEPIPEELAAIEDPPEPPAPSSAAAPAPLTREQVESRYAQRQSFEGEDLTGVDLSGAVLSGANFKGAILSGAKFVRAVLDHACFDDATLTGVDFTEAQLSEASLKGADLPQAVVRGADLAGADLEGASALESDWSRSRLAGAKMRKADLSGSRAESVDFRGAQMDESDFTGAVLDGSDFTQASLVDAWCEGISAVRCNFTDADLTKFRGSAKANFTESVFQNVKAKGARFRDSRADRANFSLSEMDGADFSSASLVQANFTGCKLKKAKFGEAVMLGAIIVRSDVFEGNFESADLSHADLRGSNFFGAQFWRAKVEHAQVQLANLKRTHLVGLMKR